MRRMSIVGPIVCIYSPQEVPIYMFLLFLCFLPLTQILCPNNSSKPVVTHLIFFYMNKLVLSLVHMPCMFALLYAYKMLII